jgi:hypothetical protein
MSKSPINIKIMAGYLMNLKLLLISLFTILFGCQEKQISSQQEQYVTYEGYNFCGKKSAVEICKFGICPIPLVCIARFYDDEKEPFASQEDFDDAMKKWAESCSEKKGTMHYGHCDHAVCTIKMAAPVQNSPGRPSECK